MAPKRAKNVQTELPSLKTNFQRSQPQEKGRGNLISSMNPKTVAHVAGIDGEDIANPFFETMPAPLVWHRNAPDRFPFGETPFMEQYLSNQIERDLKMDKENKDADIMPGAIVSPWDLPDVPDEEVLAAMKEFEQEDGATTLCAHTGEKRTAGKQKTNKTAKKRKTRK